MEKKFLELPEFSNEVLEQIKAEHIKVRGKKAEELWKSGKMNLDYIKEDYQHKRLISINHRLIAEGKEKEKIETPLCDELSKKIKKAIAEDGRDPEECYKEMAADHNNAHDAVMRFCSKLFNEFRSKEN